MIIVAEYSENVVSKGFKTRSFVCRLERDIGDADENEIGIVYDELHVKCVKEIRRVTKEYMKNMAHPEHLVDGKEVQFTKMKGTRYKI